MTLSVSVSKIFKRTGLLLSCWADRLYISDRNRLKRAFEERDAKEMLKTSFPLDRSSVVIDVGGYRGDWASDIYSRYRCRILILEPVPTFCGHLRKRFAGNPDIQIIQAGLDAHSKEAVISLQEDGTSLVRGSESKQNVQMLGIEDLLEQEHLDRISLMKANIEGAEYDLLDHMMEHGLTARVDNFLIQFHDFVPDAKARMGRIQEGLRATHRPLFQYGFIWEAWTLK
jgi:FkbM family methyltransferase